MRRSTRSLMLRWTRFGPERLGGADREEEKEEDDEEEEEEEEAPSSHSSSSTRSPMSQRSSATSSSSPTCAQLQFIYDFWTFLLCSPGPVLGQGLCARCFATTGA